MKKRIQNISADIPASIVVLLVALPLCLGVALASGAPLFSGIIAGVVGGIVVGLLSKSALSVSGPAAGLTVIVASSIIKLQHYEAFLLAVVIAGMLQIGLGILKAGLIGDYIPNSVIKAMLAAIGLILILKQIPHFVGYDKNFEGDESFKQLDSSNTFTEIINSISFITPAALLIGVVCLFILIFWENKKIKSNQFLQLIPGPLVAVVVGVLISNYFSTQYSQQALSAKQLVSLPIAPDFKSFFSFFTFPDIVFLKNPDVWITAVTLAIVASLETLLSVEAIDKLDTLKRVTPTNRELIAQGVGNMASGLIGGIPITAVIVRGSANVGAGAKTKLSTILHGMLLLISVVLIPNILNQIPLSALAAILIFTGYKLAKVQLFKMFYKKGWDQFIPFIVTILVILLTDLLIGIVIGIIVGLFFMIRSNFKSAVLVVNDQNRYLVRLRKDVSFLNKPIIKKKLEEIPKDSFLLLDATRADFIDKDIIEEVNNFLCHAHLKNIKVEIKKSNHKEMHQLFHHPKNSI